MIKASCLSHPELRSLLVWQDWDTLTTIFHLICVISFGLVIRVNTTTTDLWLKHGSCSG